MALHHRVYLRNQPFEFTDENMDRTTTNSNLRNATCNKRFVPWMIMLSAICIWSVSLLSILQRTLWQHDNEGLPSSDKHDSGTRLLLRTSLNQTETSNEAQDGDEIDEHENVSWSAKLLTSTWNPILTSIAKHALDWFCWNTNDNIFWNFEVKDPSTKTIAFSVDDAPGKGLKGMTEILDIMKEYQVHCTFFIISSHIRDPNTKRIDKKVAAVIERMLADGHELGNHAIFHEKLINLSEEQYMNAIKECDDVIAEFDHGFRERKVKWYRPPHGVMTKTHYKVVTNMGYKIAMSNKFGNDVEEPQNYHFLVDFYTQNVNAGDISLMHTPDESMGRYQLLRAMKTIIHKLHCDGVRMTTLSNVYDQSVDGMDGREHQ